MPLVGCHVSLIFLKTFVCMFHCLVFALFFRVFICSLVLMPVHFIGWITLTFWKGFSGKNFTLGRCHCADLAGVAVLTTRPNPNRLLSVAVFPGVSVIDIAGSSIAKAFCAHISEEDCCRRADSVLQTKCFWPSCSL